MGSRRERMLSCKVEKLFRGDVLLSNMILGHIEGLVRARRRRNQGGHRYRDRLDRSP